MKTLLPSLNDFKNRANLTCQRKNGLILFDYNKTCSFAFDWDEITLNSRGIVFDEASGKVVARGFQKFFNLEELFVDNQITERGMLLPESYRPNFHGECMILEKVDGSCGITYFHNGSWHVNTRGSFGSDQAIWASEFLYRNIRTDLMNVNHTYMFEIIYPENRIVVDYGDKEMLVLTGIIDTETGEEFWYDHLEAEAKKIGCDVVKIFKFDRFEDVFKARELWTVNEEGMVITFRNGYKFKLKGAAYCNVHRKMNNLTPLAFWDAFDVDSFCVPDSFLVELPEEFRDTVDELKSITEQYHNNEYAKVREFVSTVPQFENDASGKKARYLYLVDNYDAEYVPLILSELNGGGRKTKDNIHRRVRPHKNSFDGVKVNSRVLRILNEN